MIERPDSAEKTANTEDSVREDTKLVTETDGETAVPAVSSGELTAYS